MLRGIGTDIVRNARFEGSPENFLRHLFTAFELEELSRRVDKTQYLASRFAAKEAVSKALGTGFSGITPLDIEIHEDEKGKPFVRFSRPMGVRVLLSITHEDAYSVAMAVAEDE